MGVTDAPNIESGIESDRLSLRALHCALADFPIGGVVELVWGRPRYAESEGILRASEGPLIDLQPARAISIRVVHDLASRSPGRSVHPASCGHYFALGCIGD